MSVAIYPGSFDPITNGHIDIIKRAAKVFENVIVLVSLNTSKTELFTADTRAALAKEALKDIDNVFVHVWDGLTVEFAKNANAKVLIRGLRAPTDFDYEFQMALANKSLCGDIETVFFAADAQNMFLSSSMVKQIASFGGDISLYVPECVEKKLKDFYGD